MYHNKIAADSRRALGFAQAPSELRTERTIYLFVFTIFSMVSFNRYTCGALLICECTTTKATHKAWLLLCVCFTKSRVFGSVFYKISFMIIIAVLFQFSPYNFMFNVRII